MKCPNCGNEIEEGKLLCEKCGEEVKMVPDFDIELESRIYESLSSLAEDITDEVPIEGVNSAQSGMWQESEYDDLEQDDDMKERLRDYYPHRTISFPVKKPVMILAGALILVVLLTVGIIYGVRISQSNSFSYQYQRAVDCAAQDHYDEAVIYLEHAVALDPEQIDARFLLARYYERSQRQQSAIKVLLELLPLETDRKEEIYDMLLGIYESRQEYEEMGAVLSDCTIEPILTKYNEYTAFEPELNHDEGVYDEILSITMSSDCEGFIYYTLDATTPNKNSAVYEDPILLESGDYTIKAMFVNMYGVESDVITKTYYINLRVPQEPVVSLDSGSYSGPQFIEIYHSEDTRIYYTMDGTTPTSRSERYTEPVEMPYGISNFSFIAINEDGLTSPVVKRTYQLSLQANFTPDLAIQVLINNLWANGELSDTQGHVPNRLGQNTYTVKTIVELNGVVYYIVYEEYIDTLGISHDTNNIYAIDSATAELYRAWKIREGSYTLRTF